MRHSAHLVPKPFDPWTSGPPREMIPIKLIPLDQQSPSNLVPLDKWSPTNLVPLDKWSPTNLVPIFPNHHSLSPWTNRILKVPFVLGTKLVGNHLSMGTEFWGTICPWGQYWLETVCPEGPINWGPIVGDQMSADHMCLGPNVSQPTLYVT